MNTHTRKESTSLENRLLAFSGRLAGLFILGFLVSGILTLKYYGISWDEGLGNMFFGERYLFFLQTGLEKFLDFKSELAALRGLPLNLFLSPFRDLPFEFPALADTLSAASMHFFAYKLQWLNAVDAWHLFTILLSALFLLAFYDFTARRMGRFAALTALAFLAVFPRFWGDMHFNPKDVPEMAFFGLAVMAYAEWYDKPGWLRALLTGLAFGAALAVKMNALFLPVILFLGEWPLRFSAGMFRDVWDHLKRTILQYVLMGFTAAGLYLASWPLLYSDPYHGIRSHLSYILSQGSRTGETAFSLQPLLMILTTMPEWMLVCLVAGIVFIAIQLHKGHLPQARLLLAWLIVPILRISLPNMSNFDGIRHFLEFLPAAAIIAGYGASSLVKWLSRSGTTRRLALSAGVIGLLAINTALLFSSFWPYPHLYFNRLVGGLPGAREAYGSHEGSDYWATSYRLGLDWLSANALPDSSLTVPVAPWTVELSAGLWLREDITLLPGNIGLEALETKLPLYVMFITRDKFYDELASYCIQNLKPVYQVITDRTPVMEIYLIQPSS
ncbi:MAG: glycosyltransferase family 39 protein [Anaerolineaceae bacterium]